MRSKNIFTGSAKTVRAAAISLATAFITPAHANLLLDGSFETPVIPPGTFSNFGPGSEPPGFDWSVTVNNVDVVSFGAPVSPGPAFDGVQFLDLVGFDSTGGIKQTFATTPGQQYTLSFEYGNNPRWPLASALVTVTSGLNTLLSQSISHGTATTTDYDWTAFSMTFVATGASADLAFTETSGGNNGGIFLDAASINPTPVPEPSSLILFGSALVSFCVMRRRRRQASDLRCPVKSIRPNASRALEPMGCACSKAAMSSSDRVVYPLVLIVGRFTPTVGSLVISPSDRAARPYVDMRRFSGERRLIRQHERFAARGAGERHLLASGNPGISTGHPVPVQIFVDVGEPDFGHVASHSLRSLAAVSSAESSASLPVTSVIPSLPTRTSLTETPACLVARRAAVRSGCRKFDGRFDISGPHPLRAPIIRLNVNFGIILIYRARCRSSVRPWSAWLQGERQLQIPDSGTGARPNARRPG